MSIQFQVPTGGLAGGPSVTTQDNIYLITWTGPGTTDPLQLIAAEKDTQGYLFGNSGPLLSPQPSGIFEAALTNFQGVPWMVYQNEVSATANDVPTVDIMVSPLGSNASTATQVGLVNNIAGSAIAATDSALYVAWNQSELNPPYSAVPTTLYFTHSSNGVTWPAAPTQLLFSENASGPPALAGYQETIYIAWAGPDGYIWFGSYPHKGVSVGNAPYEFGTTWGGWYFGKLGFRTLADYWIGPALAVGDSGIIHLVWPGHGPGVDSSLWAASLPTGLDGTNADNWSKQKQIPNVMNEGSPALASQLTPSTDILLSWTDLSGNLWIGPLDKLVAQAG